MTGMASKGIFESRGGNKEREAIWHNIANNFQKTAKNLQERREVLEIILLTS